MQAIQYFKSKKQHNFLFLLWSGTLNPATCLVSKDVSAKGTFEIKYTINILMLFSNMSDR